MIHPLKSLISDQILFSNVAKLYGTPTYIYDKNQLVKNITSINNALINNFQKFQICYTIKANSNPAIIDILKTTIPGLGADCSSPGELFAAKIGGISTSDCIYTGNYESDDDLKSALEQDAHINLDDICSLHRLKKIGIPQEISFRLNPGFGKGAFSEVVTGGKNSKFGVPKENIVDAYKLAKEIGIKEFGLQCMTGSGVLDPEYFPKLMLEILKISELIMNDLNIEFNHISIGGGYGIPYRKNEEPLNFELIFKNVSEIFHNFFRGKRIPSFWIEPGRSVIGNAGILLSQVTGLKKSYKNFIGLDAGMETLMRPALYNAYHHIYKIGHLESGSKQVVDFTGRICENTDRLAVDRSFPDIIEGDLVAIMDVGAYGFSMSHQFCTRPKSAEVIIDHGKVKLIRKRETIKQIFENCEPI